MPVMAARKNVWTAERIRELRERLGLSISEAAARLGVSRPTWSNWERGTRKLARQSKTLLDLLDKEII